MTNFVLLHGAFHGGWCWRDVAAPLRAHGHIVFTPTQTGLGERRHLLSADITLDTFVQDLVEVMIAEDITDAVLVGHSFGGNAISGVADLMPERVRHLVYLDSMILEHGDSPFSRLRPEVAAERTRLAQASGGLSIPPPAPAAFGVPDGAGADWLRERLTPHPFATFTSKLTLRHPVGNGRPCTYIVCTDPIYGPLQSSRDWVQGRPGWAWREIATGHDAMVTAPGALAAMLEEIAG